MKRAAAYLVLALMCSPVFLPHPGHAATPAKPPPSAPAKSKLAKPYTLATGELVALKVSELINSFHMVQVPVLAAYDKDEDDIQIMLFGESATVDDAKQVLSAFRTKTLEAIRLFGEKVIPKL